MAVILLMNNNFEFALKLFFSILHIFCFRPTIWLRMGEAALSLFLSKKTPIYESGFADELKFMLRRTGTTPVLNSTLGFCILPFVNNLESSQNLCQEFSRVDISDTNQLLWLSNRCFKNALALHSPIPEAVDSSKCYRAIPSSIHVYLYSMMNLAYVNLCLKNPTEALYYSKMLSEFSALSDSMRYRASIYLFECYILHQRYDLAMNVLNLSLKHATNSFFVNCQLNRAILEILTVCLYR